MNQVDIKKDHNSLKQKLLIFIGTAFFAIHTLIYIVYFRLNFPYGDDGLVWPVAYEYAKTGQFPFEMFLSSASSHLTYSLKLISLPNLLWNSFDMVNFYYLQWIIMSLTLFFFFLIIRRTDKKLFWVLIPISASVYCPIFIVGYYVFSTIMWLSVALCITIVVYLVTKNKITPVVSIAAISIATYATFFNLIGVIAWIPGLIGFLRKESHQKYSYKKWLIPWLIAAGVLGTFIIFTAPSISEQSKLHLFFSLDGLSFLVTYLATSYRFGSENIFLSQIVGSITLVICAYLTYYFLKINKENFQKAFPWILFLVISILAGMFIALGRMDLGYHDGNESFYKTISFFSQIGILVLISMILINVRKNSKDKKRYVKIILIMTVIFSQMIFLIPSYYAGWEKGEYYFDQKMVYVNCYSLSHGTECLYPPPVISGMMAPAFERSDLEFFNYLAENQLGIFGEPNFNKQNMIDISEFNSLLQNDVKSEVGFGQIEKINGKIINDEVINIKENFINLEGWILDQNKKPVENIFLMINDKPFLKYDDFIPREDIEKTDGNYGWNIIFLSGYLENGCHEILVIGQNEQKIIEQEKGITICKNE